MNTTEEEEEEEEEWRGTRRARLARRNEKAYQSYASVYDVEVESEGGAEERQESDDEIGLTGVEVAPAAHSNEHENQSRDNERRHSGKTRSQSAPRCSHGVQGTGYRVQRCSNGARSSEVRTAQLGAKTERACCATQSARGEESSRESSKRRGAGARAAPNAACIKTYVTSSAGEAHAVHVSWVSLGTDVKTAEEAQASITQQLELEGYLPLHAYSLTIQFLTSLTQPPLELNAMASIGVLKKAKAIKVDVQHTVQLGGEECATEVMGGNEAHII